MMRGRRLGTQVVVCGLLGTSIALGLPLFHYVTALMIAIVLRHGGGERGLLRQVEIKAAGS